MTPFLIVLAGLVFILRAKAVVTPDAAAILWGVIIMCIGFQKMARGMCKCESNHHC